MSLYLPVKPLEWCVMDKITRFVLRVLGWRSYKCRDGMGTDYEAWTRKASYFHIYHEKNGDEVIRPDPVIKYGAK